DVLAPLGESGQAEDPEVDAGEQVLAEPPLAHRRVEVAVRSRDELEVAARLAVAAHGQEDLVLEGAQEHGLLVWPELADLVEEEDAPVRAAQESGARLVSAGEGAAHVTEERGHRRVAAQRRAVHLDEGPRHLMPRLLQLVDAPG